MYSSMIHDGMYFENESTALAAELNVGTKKRSWDDLSW